MIFGERAITENKPRSIDIVALDFVEVYAFHPDSFIKVYPYLVSHFEKISEYYLRDEQERISNSSKINFMKTTNVDKINCKQIF